MLKGKTAFFSITQIVGLAFFFNLDILMLMTEFTCFTWLAKLNVYY